MILDQDKIDELYSKLSEVGIGKVKENLSAGIYGAKAKYVKTWIQQQEEQKADTIQDKAEAREETNIELAKEANKFSKVALFLSGLAVIVSIIGALIGLLAVLSG